MMGIPDNGLLLICVFLKHMNAIHASKNAKKAATFVSVNVILTEFLCLGKTVWVCSCLHECSNKSYLLEL